MYETKQFGSLKLTRVNFQSHMVLILMFLYTTNASFFSLVLIFHLTIFGWRWENILSKYTTTIHEQL